MSLFVPMENAQNIPAEIRLRADKKALVLVYANPAGRAALPAKLLRLESPSAEVKGHFGKGGKIPEVNDDLTITGIEAVGNYAVKLVFSDGHQTGIYTWEYLYNLAEIIGFETAA